MEKSWYPVVFGYEHPAKEHINNIDDEPPSLILHLASSASVPGAV